MRSMTQALAVLLVPLALLGVVGVQAGCGDSDEQQVAARPFPLRVLNEQAGDKADQHVVFENELDALDEWWVVATAPDGSLQVSSGAQALAAGAVVHHEGLVTLPPGTLLMRPVSLAGPVEYALSARLRGPQSAAGDVCVNLRLFPAARPAGERLLDLPLANREQLERLAQMLDQAGAETAAGAPPPQVTWRQNAGPDGFALARWLGWIDAGEPKGDTHWIVIVARDQPLDVDRVRLSVAPQLHAGSNAGNELPVDTREISIERMRLGGDSRLAAYVPPRRVMKMPVVVPPEAADLALGVCPDPAVMSALPAGETLQVHWSVRAQPGHHLITEFTETVEHERPVVFTDHVVAWPAGLQGELTLEFEVTGATGMVFGQPRLRGPEHGEAPSLLLISIDTLRADHVSGLGYGRPTTPFLDKLAARGTLFTDVTAVSSYTLPTHASLFTGVFPPRHLALDTSDRLNTKRTPTLPMLLAEAGFLTAGFTGGGFVSGDYGFQDGFDRYSTVDPIALPPGVPGHGLGVVAAWIERQGQRSWFAFLHTYAAHDYAPPPRDLKLFERAPAPPGFDPYELLDRRDPAVTPPTPAELDRLTDLYDASIRHVDRRLRELIEPLTVKGVLDQTWIVITSDHGEELLEHGRLRHRGTLYQELTHVPLLVVPPAGSTGAPAGQRIDEPVSQVDVFATLLDLLGRPLPEGGDGSSLAGFVRGGPRAGAPTPLYSQVERREHARSSLRSGEWKLVRNDVSEARIEPGLKEWELFDLQHDPGERHDLEPEQGEHVESLRARLLELEAGLQTQVGERLQFQPDAELLQRLTELGYLGAER